MPREKNLLLVIGAPFDPIPPVEKLINALEERRRNLWAKEARVGTNQNYYKALSEHYNSMLTTLQDPAHVAELASEAKEVVYNAVEETLRQADTDNDGVIESSKLPHIRAIAKQAVRDATFVIDFDLDEGLVRERASRLGYIWGEAQRDDSSDVYKKYKKKVADELKFKKNEENLRAYGVPDLYEFAAPLGTSDGRRATNEELLARAGEIRASFRRNTTDEATAAQLEKACIEAFASAESRANYDAYLTKAARNRALGSLARKAEMAGGLLSAQAQREAVEELSPLVDTPRDARPLLVGFCAEKGIKLEQDPALAAKVWCRCGRVNEKGATICAGCGLPLEITCPHCGKTADILEDRCPFCGEPLGAAVDEAVKLCKDAERAARSLDFLAAATLIERAAKTWPPLPEIARTRAKVASLDKLGKTIGARLSTAMEKKRYREALEALSQAESIPGIDKAAIAARKAIALKQTALADDLSHRAAECSEQEAAAELYDQALALCADHAAARSFLNAHPPAPARSVRAETYAAQRVVRLAWLPSLSKGTITYEVIALPKDGSPRRKLCDTTGTTVECRDVPVGVAIEYQVVASRAEVASRAASPLAPVVLMPELEGLKIVPAHEAVELFWKPLASTAQVHIREVSGTIAPVATRGPHHTITNLKDGTTYTFELNMVYDIAGEGTVKGTSERFSVTPIDTTHPIELLTARPSKGIPGRFDLVWEGPVDRVRFFSTLERDEVPPLGSALTLAELERTFDNPNVEVLDTGKGTLSWTKESPLYLFAVNVYGDSAVVGAHTRAVNGGEIEVSNLQVVNGSLMADATVKDPTVNGFIVLVRHDRYATGLEDEEQGTLRKIIGKRQWERDGKLVVPGVAGKQIFMSVFARTGTGPDTSFSDATEAYLDDRTPDRIVYTFSIDTPRAMRGFLGGGTATFKFRSEQGGPFELPRVRIACSVGRVPHMSPDATDLDVFGPTHVDREYSVSVKLPRTRDLWIEAYPVTGATASFITQSGYEV